MPEGANGLGWGGGGGGRKYPERYFKQITERVNSEDFQLSIRSHIEIFKLQSRITQNSRFLFSSSGHFLHCMLFSVLHKCITFLVVWVPNN